MSSADTPLASYSITVRLKIDNKPGMLGEVTSAIGQAGGDIGAIDIVEVVGQTMIRDITFKAGSEAHGEQVVERRARIARGPGECIRQKERRPGAVAHEDLFFDSAGFGMNPAILVGRNRDREWVAKVPILGSVYRDQAVYVGATIRGAGEIRHRAGVSPRDPVGKEPEFGMICRRGDAAGTCFQSRLRRCRSHRCGCGWLPRWWK